MADPLGDGIYLPDDLLTQDAEIQMASITAGSPVRQARDVWTGADVPAVQAAVRATPLQPPNQFDPSLTPEEAYAACGPAAAIVFAQAVGRYPTLREAVELARSVGWTTQNGMAGPHSEQSLLAKLGVSAHVENGVDWNRIQADVLSGNPVIIDTPAHYFVATAYDPETGKYYFGHSGTAIRGGSQWMRPDEIPRISGSLNTTPRMTLYLDSPHATLPSPAAGTSTMGSIVDPPIAASGEYTWDTPEGPLGGQPGASMAYDMPFDDWLDNSPARMEAMYQSMSTDDSIGWPEIPGTNSDDMGTRFQDPYGTDFADYDERGQIV